MKRNLYTVDADLELALQETRRRAERVRTGRVWLELHLLAGMLAEYRIEESRSTEREVARVMEEPPVVRLGKTHDHGKR